MTHPIFDTDKQYNRERIIKDLDTRDATIEAQAKTIERLADALEILVDYIRDAAEDHDCINWYAVNKDEGEAARALLAEIRGKDA